MQVVLYSRPGCSLCEKALAVLERVRGEHPFSLAVKNIDDDPALFAAHRYDIPVVEIDGEVVFRHRVDERALRRLLAPEGEAT